MGIAMIATEPTRAEQVYAAAEHDLRHWQKLILAGWLSAAQREEARCEMVRAAGRKVRAERAMEEEEQL